MLALNLEVTFQKASQLFPSVLIYFQGGGDMAFHGVVLILFLLLHISTHAQMAPSELVMTAERSSASGSNITESPADAQWHGLAAEAEYLHPNLQRVVRWWQRARRHHVLEADGAEAAASQQKPKKGDRAAPLDVTNNTWLWVPALVIVSFVAMLLMTKKLKMLGGLSVRVYLMRYISVETIYSTMEGMTDEEVQEQRDAEWGHQAFSFIGFVFMVAHKIFNPNSDERYAFVALSNIQIVLMPIAVVFDCYLISTGYLRVVRGVNTKLRWAHCVYQMVLFMSDLVGDDLQLPIDCFIWATVHYSYEAIGLALWALNVDGLSEMAIIILINAKIVSTSVASTGWTCAFGLCSLFLSSLSLVVAMGWKWKFRVRDSDRPAPLSESDDASPVRDSARVMSCSGDVSLLPLPGVSTAPPQSTRRLSFLGRQRPGEQTLQRPGR